MINKKLNQNHIALESVFGCKTSVTTGVVVKTSAVPLLHNGAGI
jgi:hypothetical protein